MHWIKKLVYSSADPFYTDGPSTVAYRVEPWAPSLQELPFVGGQGGTCTVTAQLQRLPPEVILLIIDGIVSGKYIDHPYEDQRIVTVKAVSLVCKAWLSRCAPELYRCIRLPSSDINKLCECLLAPSSLVRTAVREVTVEFTEPGHCLRLGRLRQLIPCITTLRTRGGTWSVLSTNRDSEDRHRGTHPNLPRVMTGLCVSFTHLTCLKIWDCRFGNSADVLRVLGSFSSLSSAELNACTWEHSSLALPALRRVPSRLQSISTSRCTPSLWPFVLTCIWPRSAENGLHTHWSGTFRDDVLMAAHLSSCLSVGINSYGQFYVRQSAYPDTWVAMIRTSFHFIEFHLVCEPLPDGTSYAGAQRHARICWVIIRTGGGSPGVRDIAPDADFEKIEHALSSMSCLQKVVHERKDNINDEDATHLLAYFKKIGREVIGITSTEGKAHAKAAKDYGQVPLAERFPISPMWYNDEFREQRALYES